MPKRKTYGKQDRSQHRETRGSQRAQDKFAILIDGEDVSESPPAKKQLLTPQSREDVRQPGKQTINMASAPSEDSIEMVTSVCICDRDTAIRYLKAKHNNVDQAVAAIFDREDISEAEAATTWDDSVWAGARDGNINDHDESRTLHPLGSSTAPTRGPSPVGSFRHPGSKEQEDADVAAALAASANDIRYGSQQETGVLKADGTTMPAYGPHQANRYQNPNDWALVKVTPATTEIVPDVDPVERRFLPGEPRFLKSAINGDYLPGFLTICHSIPAARQLFMLKNYARYDYGIDMEWWKGHQISLPRVVHTGDGSPTDPVLARYDDFMAELQRLMAFLDISTRAYATTIALEQTGGMSLHGKTAQASQKTNVDTFIKELASAYHSLGQRADVVEGFFGLQAGSEAGEIDTKILEVFHFDVDTSAGARALPEILDDVLWDIDAEVEPEDRYLERLPEVLVMRLKQTGSAGTLQVNAPSVLHMDKYLRENVEIVRPLRQRIYDEKKRILQIGAVEKRLKTWQPARGPAIDAQSLLLHAKSQFVAEPEEATPTMVNGIADSTDADQHDIALKLDAIIQSINKKLTILEEEKTKTQKTLSELSAVPSTELATRGDHRYTLVGVSTKPNITYILCPREDSEQMLVDDREDEDETPPGMQWWRIEYATNGNKATINRNQIAAYEALPAIEHEHHTALLVYASDDALNVQQAGDRTLSEALQKFIQDDNGLFQQELRDNPPPSYAYDMSMTDDAERPRESIERRESFDSIKAQGSSDVGDFDDRDPTQHASFGLGYGAEMEYGDPPVAEIPPPTDDVLHAESSEVAHTGGAIHGQAKVVSDEGYHDSAD